MHATLLALTSLLVAAPQESARAPATRDLAAQRAADASSQGYARMPSVRGDTVVFVAEGDLWRVPLDGGRATRLTTHPGDERMPAISPDGSTIAFVAGYEGPREVYTMPIDGGLPTRRTYAAGGISFVGWAPDGALLHASDAGAAISASRLFRQDMATNERSIIPLAQCADGAFLGDGATLYFTRLEFQGSHTDRYEGGTAQLLWRFEVPATGTRGAEAVPLTTDYDGTSKAPMVGSDGRVYFLSDRSGRINVWSMAPDGADLRQHSHEDRFDIGSAAMDGMTIVYQLGPDLRRLDVGGGEATTIPITLDSDFDQTRERWIADGAREASSMHPSPDGDRVAVTTRGRVFVVPTKDGRTVDVDPRPDIRYRAARFIDDTTLVAVSDEWGELELALLPANGVGAPTRLTSDGATVRWQAIASPDGTRIAHSDKRQRLWVFDRAANASTLVEENAIESIDDFTWSPDSQWLAYVASAPNKAWRIKLWNAGTGAVTAVTTDRYDSFAPEWSPDGAWLWFRSDRSFESVVRSPWGPRAPEPFLARTGRLYGLGLQPGTRWPFRPSDELLVAERRGKDEDGKEGDEEKKADAGKAEPSDEKGTPTKPKPKPKPVEIELEGVAARLHEVPMPVSNLNGSPVLATEKALFWLANDPAPAKGGEGATLFGLAISNDSPEPKAVMSGVRSAQLTSDRKRILVRKGDAWQFIDARPEPAGPGEKGEKQGKEAIDFGGVTFSTSPRDEWRQMLIDAWRLLRDYFYARNMHGVDWRATLDKYLPWVERVRSRDELNDVLQELTGELSALHHFVRGEGRRGPERVEPGSFGAEFARDEAGGGFVVEWIPTFDPDEPWARPPLAALGVGIAVGDVITMVDGVAALSVDDLSSLLRAKAGRQTLVQVRSKDGAERDVIVVPVSQATYADMRYRGWELERRARVEELGKGEIGYVHLRAMGSGDFADFARDFYPVFARKGLILDVRSNRGGNIDSWILGRLLRKAWMYWNQANGRSPEWNMQYAFRGHMVVLCNENTASDGEACAEGFRRLGLGTVIGTRTWGGEIWLSSSNRLLDGGIATAGESGVFDEEGVWLIEGRGVEPDVVVDNLPHATFLGEDAQLSAAIEHLEELIRKEPRDIPPVPPFPTKGQR